MVIGTSSDQQQLPFTCRAAQSDAEKLRSQVDKLQRENQLLRARLGEDIMEPDSAIPRKLHRTYFASA